LPLVRSGQVRALAVTSAKRSAFAPELPTIAESGVPGYDYTAWYGLYVPAKTPGEIVRKLHDDTAAALEHPQVTQRFAEIATVATPSTTAELAALLKSDMELWALSSKRPTSRRNDAAGPDQNSITLANTKGNQAFCGAGACSVEPPLWVIRYRSI
jgi:hypothetical protein